MTDPHGQETAARLAQRPLPTRPAQPSPRASFEFFPPPDDEGMTKLENVAAALATFDPTFVSVTYGAGGSTRDRTITAVRALVDQGLDVAGHITCVAATPESTQDVLDAYAATGIRRVVALRGDQPAGDSSPPAYADATELVGAIRARTDGDQWDISVAAYPEVHPRAASAEADLDVLEAKFAAGADRAITQFFFDNDVFLRFRDQAEERGFADRLVPGIMPVSNFARTSQFAEKCGASIPDWLPGLFDGLDDAPEIRRMIAATVAAEGCHHLAEHGVDAFHFYTMNQANLTSAVCRILGVQRIETTAGTVAG